MGTIVQEYGPIYGEVVNGTVQGRPNGSVYVPLSNTISMSISAEYVAFKTEPNRYQPCRSNGAGVLDSIRIVAQSQDLASYIVRYIYSDAELTTQIAAYTATAGNFNIVANGLIYGVAENQLVDGETYYVIAKLMNNGVPVAVSSVVELTAVVP